MKKPAAAQKPQPIPPVRKRVQKTFKKPSLTKQSFREETDLNTIVAKYIRGEPVMINRQQPIYQDNFVHSYQDVQNKIIQAHAEFAKLPSDIREKFDNDPRHFLDFVADPENTDELIKMGLNLEPIKEAGPTAETEPQGEVMAPPEAPPTPGPEEPPPAA